MASGLLGDVLGSIPGVDDTLEPDPYELARLMAHPVGADAKAFFQQYDEWFGDLGGQIFDDPAFYEWPHYHAEAMVSGILQALALGSDHWAHRPDVLVYDAGFELLDGAPLTHIDPAAPPETVVAWAEIFIARGEALEVELRVVADRPGIAAAPSPSVGKATATVQPGATRTRLEAIFNPGPELAETPRFVLEWRVAGDEKAFLTSDFEQYLAFAEGPLFRPPWSTVYGSFPPSLGVDHTTALSDVGSLRGHVHSGGAGVAAQVSLGGEKPAPTNGSGAFAIDGLEPGEVTVVAHAPGFAIEPVPATVVAAAVTPVLLPAMPIPILDNMGEWTSAVDHVQVAWSTAHFPLPAEAVVEVAALLNPAEDDLPAEGAWSPTDGGDAASVPLPVQAAHGDLVVAFVQAGGGPPVRASPLEVDLTAPPEPVLSVTATSCPNTVSVTVTGEDPESPVVGAAAGTSPTADTANPVQASEVLLVVLDGQPGPKTVYGFVSNAAGLWSAPAQVTVCEVAPPVAEQEPAIEGSTPEPPPPVAESHVEESVEPESEGG